MEAEVIGKPSATFFLSVLNDMALQPHEVGRSRHAKYSTHDCAYNLNLVSHAMSFVSTIFFCSLTNPLVFMFDFVFSQPYIFIAPVGDDDR